MASSVQFTSSEAVLTAFLNRNCPAWSIWQGRQFMFKNEGSNAEESEKQLIEILTVLEQSSNAIYTLKVYEELKGKIKENTPCDGSFNFKLNAETQLITNNQYSRMNNQNELLTRLAAIEARLQDEPEEEEDETERTLGKIGALMNNPVVMQLAQMIFGAKPAASSQLAITSGSIAGVPESNDNERINQAVAILKTKDARLADHLTKLAEIATTQPGSFDFLLKSLDSL